MTSKPDVIKAALSVGIIQCEICDKPKPDPNNIWRCLNCNGKLYTVPKAMVNKFDTSDFNLGLSKKGYAVPSDSVYTKEIWNEAIEAVIHSLQYAHAFTKKDLGSIVDEQAIAILNSCEIVIRRLKK